MVGLAYLGLIIFIICLENIRKKDTKIDFLTLFNVFYILLYLLPSFIFAADIINVRTIRYLEYRQDTEASVLLAIFLGYFAVLLGFSANSAQKAGNKILIRKISDQKIACISLFFLVLSIVSLVIFSSQYGGIITAVSKANLIRNGAVEGGTLSFFKRFLYLAFNAAYLLAALAFIKQKKKFNFTISLLFILSLIVALVASLIVASRSTMILAFSIFYFVYVIKTNKWHFKFLIPLMVSAVLIILYGKAFFFSLTGIPDGFSAVGDKFMETINEKESSNYSFKDLIGTFAYPVYSLYAALSENYELRLLTDWIYGILSFLPDRLLDLEPNYSMSYNNTFYLANNNEFDIPTGHLAACIYSLSWPGLFFFSWIYGWIGRFLQTMMVNYLEQLFWMPFIYIVSAKVWSDVLTYGDPTTFLQTNFCQLILVISVTLMAINSKTKIS